MYNISQKEKGCRDILVSVIITTYKRPVEILKRAITSVLNQTYKKMEIIIVNDCPEDISLTKEIANMINLFNDKRLKYIIHKKNMGACAARNTGIKSSKGKFIALLDDDDEWLPEKIEYQLLGFTSETVGMVYSPFYNVDIKLKKRLTIRGTKSGNLLNDLLKKSCIGGSSMSLIRREVFNKCGFFDERFLSSQDYDMWIRISEKYDIVCINKPLTIRYMQEDSITTNFEKQKQGFELLIKKHMELYQKNPAALNYRLNIIVKEYIKQGLFKEAKKIYLQAIKVKIISVYNIIEPMKGIIKYIKVKI